MVPFVLHISATVCFLFYHWIGWVSDSPYRQPNSSQSKSMNIHNWLEEIVWKKSISQRELVPSACGNKLVREWLRKLGQCHIQQERGEPLPYEELVLHQKVPGFFRRVMHLNTCFRKGGLNFSIFFCIICRSESHNLRSVSGLSSRQNISQQRTLRPNWHLHL